MQLQFHLCFLQYCFPYYFHFDSFQKFQVLRIFSLFHLQYLLYSALFQETRQILHQFPISCKKFSNFMKPVIRYINFKSNLTANSSHKLFGFACEGALASQFLYSSCRSLRKSPITNRFKFQEHRLYFKDNKFSSNR